MAHLKIMERRFISGTAREYLFRRFEIHLNFVEYVGNIRTSGVLHFIIGVILADVSKGHCAFIVGVKKKKDWDCFTFNFNKIE